MAEEDGAEAHMPADMEAALLELEETRELFEAANATIVSVAPPSPHIMTVPCLVCRTNPACSPGRCPD